jgi:hypothetical protein
VRVFLGCNAARASTTLCVLQVAPLVLAQQAFQGRTDIHMESACLQACAQAAQTYRVNTCCLLDGGACYLKAGAAVVAVPAAVSSTSRAGVCQFVSEQVRSLATTPLTAVPSLWLRC